MSEDANYARRFAERTKELGLRLDAEDEAALRAGWLGMQAQLALVRQGLTRADRPPRPRLDRL